MSLSEELSGRLVSRRPKCSAAEAYFGIGDSDAEKLWQLVWKVAPFEVNAGEINSQINRWSLIFRRRGFRGDQLLEKLADQVVEKWAKWGVWS